VRITDVGSLELVVSSNKKVMPYNVPLGYERSFLPTTISTLHALWKPSIWSVIFGHNEKTGYPYFSNDEVLCIK
jgi:hypothetical protein